MAEDNSWESIPHGEEYSQQLALANSLKEQQLLIQQATENLQKERARLDEDWKALSERLDSLKKEKEGSDKTHIEQSAARKEWRTRMKEILEETQKQAEATYLLLKTICNNGKPS